MVLPTVSMSEDEEEDEEEEEEEEDEGTEGSLADFIEHDEDEGSGDSSYEEDREEDEEDEDEDEDEDEEEDEEEEKEEADEEDSTLDSDDASVIREAQVVATEVVPEGGLRRSTRSTKGKAPVKYMDEYYVDFMLEDVDVEAVLQDDEDED